MDKKPLLLNQDFMSSILLVQMALGSLAAVLLLTVIPLGFGGLNFIIPNPASRVMAENILHWIWIFKPWIYAAIFLGGLSAVLYTFVVKDADSKIFLRVWGIILMGVLFFWVRPSLIK